MQATIHTRSHSDDLEGRDKNLQGSQIRRDIIDAEPKYYKSSTALFTGMKSKHHHILVGAVACSYSETNFLPNS